MAEVSREDVVLCDVADGVALVTLNRPEHNNAWIPEMEVRYFDVLDQLDVDSDVRVIVVTGAGRMFCPGADFAFLETRTRGEGEPVVRTRPMSHTRTIRKPVIAAINGGCAGLGLVQALFCDIRFAAAGARIATSFARRGSVAEFGIAWVLVRQIGAANAAEVLLSGRTMTSEEAHSLGMVHRIFAAEELLPATLEYARDLATSCSPAALACIKQQLDDVWSQPFEEAESAALTLFWDPRIMADFREGVASYVERRPPRFAPLPPRAEWETGAT